MPKCDFNKVAFTLRHGSSLENLLYFFETPFLKNTSGRLVLHYYVCLKSKMLCIRRFSTSSSSSPRLLGISGNSEKNILQNIKKLIQFNYFLLQKDIFLVYSLFEQVATKGNFPETT